MTSRAVLLGVLLAACAPALKTKPSGPTPEAEPKALPADTTKGPTPNLPPIARQPAAPPTLAHLRGWMPLASTGVPAFLAAHPKWDGRGVLIGILDSGLDGGIAGLDSTSTGAPKILDLRDFSGEGRIALSPLAPEGDLVAVGGIRLSGLGRVRGLSAGPWFGGLLRERRLGEMPASDVNENGSDGDSLAIVVSRATDGWVLFADTDGDGSLGDERPVHDYLVARETFGWHRAGGASPLTAAANFAERDGKPTLDLLFDTDAHGTHVAGIAAARNIGGVAGFNGVAPGAQVIGLKISRNDFGGITTTGSVMAAVDYALRFAARRNLPLVLNMSFGVGNEREGAARLDLLLDSVLAAHPEVVFVTSAGNDGPGLSTMGFPGSARRAITVGATQPAVFSPGMAYAGVDPLLFFSSRGGELAKPDVAAPGTAYSTVPRWNVGDEFKTGTSMASPYVAGLAALLLSGALEEHRGITSGDVRRALTGSARPIPGMTVLDAGAGIPDVVTAWGILRGPAPLGEFDVELESRPAETAAFAETARPDTLVTFRIVRRRGTAPMELLLKRDVAWLRGPSTVSVAGPVTTVTLVQHPPAAPGVYVGTVTATAPGVEGPVFTLVSSVVVPEAQKVAPVRVAGHLASGAERRVLFAADSGRPFHVRVSTSSMRERVVAALHQPGGSPILGENGIPGGSDSSAAIYDVDGRDARSGYYEAIAVAALDGAATAEFAIDHAPVGLNQQAGPADSFSAVLTPLGDSVVSGRLRMGLLGGERRFATGGTGGDDVFTRFTLPAWARSLVVDLELDPRQWPQFTDFGVTVLDSAGRILGKAPANYARSRLTVEIPSRPADETATLVLSPGFAELGSREAWSGRVSLRLETARPVAIMAAEGDEFRLAPGKKAAFRARIAELPSQLPEGFGPLGIFLVESGGIAWTWELPLLPGPQPGRPSAPGKP